MPKVLRIIGVAVVCGLLLFVMIASSSTQKTAAEQVWIEGATIGSLEAKKSYVMYTDIACPYCDVFTRLTIENEDEFNQFLADNDILYEVRVTDMLYESSDIDYSHGSADGVYCAARGGKYMDYYHAAVMALWEDYHSKGYGASKTGPKISGMPDDYWKQVGHNLGLGTDFDKCMDEHEADEEIAANTAKAGKVFAANSAGLPFFQFGDFTFSGFDNNWTWKNAKQLLESGLKK